MHPTLSEPWERQGEKEGRRTNDTILHNPDLPVDILFVLRVLKHV